MSSYRVGCGFDAHRLVPGRPLMLGGIAVPHERGLEGHSDGDSLIHAVCDALLGAAGEGDMGRHFPSSDARWARVASATFLTEVARILKEAGFRVENVDATVIADAPRLATYVQDMRGTIARALDIEAAVVSVKVKSTDGLGALGRREGIAAQAVALLRKDH